MAGRRRWTMRHAAWAAAAVAIGTALFIIAMGLRHDRAIDRLAAEGAVTQGRALPRNYGSCRGGSCASDVVDVEYSVGGRRYFTYQTIPSDPDRKPILEPRLVGVPRLGPERPFQVVYLPADPAVARVRADLKKGGIIFFAAGGFFLFIGLVFAAVARFALRPRGGLAG